MRIRRYLYRAMPRSGGIARFRKTKFSPAETERRRAFFAECDAAYAAMQADSERCARPRAELDGALADAPAPSPAAKLSPGEAERRRVFAIEYNAAYEAMQADPEVWARDLAEHAELDGTLMDGLDGIPTTRFSPAEIERRRAFFAECDAAYVAMQANPALWEAEMAERRLWEATLLDGLEED
jgi:hypothetical protein